MDTQETAYDRYMQQRTELLAKISVHERRIQRFLLVDRCFGGMVALAGVATLLLLLVDSAYAVVGPACVVVITLLQIVIHPVGLASGESDKKRTAEEHLRILDEAWRQWVAIWSSSAGQIADSDPV